MDSPLMRILGAAAGTVFTFLLTLALWVGTQTNQKLDTLQNAIIGLTTRLAVLEQIVQQLPPPQWQTRIRLLEERVEHMEADERH